MPQTTVPEPVYKKRKIDATNQEAIRRDRAINATIAQELSEVRKRYEEHIAKERIFWCRQLKAAKRLNCYTLFAAVAGTVAAVALIYTLKEAHSATVAANRAWLSPVTAQSDTKNLLTFTVIYRNTGREPALQFTAQEDIGHVPAPGNASWFTVFHKDTIKDVCSRTNVDTKISIYQTGWSRPEHYYVQTNTAPEAKVLNGNEVLFLHGCFAYRSPITGDDIHKSEYCFLFPPGSPAIKCMFGNKEAT